MKMQLNLKQQPKIKKIIRVISYLFSSSKCYFYYSQHAFLQIKKLLNL